MPFFTPNVYVCVCVYIYILSNIYYIYIIRDIYIYIPDNFHNVPHALTALEAEINHISSIASDPFASW